MNEWAPETRQVRAHYVFDQSDRWDPERGEAFDRWLAKVKADAWDEGHDAGQHNEHEFREGRKLENPYREGK